MVILIQKPSPKDYWSFLILMCMCILMVKMVQVGVR